MPEDDHFLASGKAEAGYGLFGVFGVGIALMFVPNLPFWIGCAVAFSGGAGTLWVGFVDVRNRTRVGFLLTTLAAVELSVSVILILHKLLPIIDSNLPQKSISANASGTIHGTEPSVNPIASLAPTPAAPAQDNEVPSILSLYATDFLKSGSNSVFGIAQKNATLSFKDGQKLLILYTLFTNITENSEFLAVYIPTSDKTFVAITYLSQNLKQLLWMPNIIFNGPFAGDGVALNKLVFTGKIFVYYETPLTLSQMGQLSDFFQAANATVEFRGPDYAIQALEAIQLGHEQYPPQYKIGGNPPVPVLDVSTNLPAAPVPSPTPQQPR